MFDTKTKKELKFNSVVEDLYVLLPEMINESISKEVVISPGEKIKDTIDLILDLKNCELIVSNENQSKFEKPNFIKVLSAEVDDFINRYDYKSENNFLIDKLKLSNLIKLQFSLL